MERYLIDMFERGVKPGALEVIFPSGDRRVFGDGSPPVVRLRLTDAGAVRAAWLDPSLQFAELYMHGRLVVEEGDIFDFLTLVKRNGAKHVASVPAVAQEVGRMFHRMLRATFCPRRRRAMSRITTIWTSGYSACSSTPTCNTPVPITKMATRR